MSQSASHRWWNNAGDVHHGGHPYRTSAAAALAPGVVLNEWSLLMLFVVLAGVISLGIVKQLILPALLDLI